MNNQLIQQKKYAYHQLKLLVEIDGGKRGFLKGVIVKRASRGTEFDSVIINGEEFAVPHRRYLKTYSPEECGYQQVGNNEYIEDANAKCKYWNKRYVKK